LNAKLLARSFGYTESIGVPQGAPRGGIVDAAETYSYNSLVSFCTVRQVQIDHRSPLLRWFVPIGVLVESIAWAFETTLACPPPSQMQEIVC